MKSLHSFLIPTLLLSLGVEALAKRELPPRTLSVDSGYFIPQYTNRAHVDFTLEYWDLLTGTHDLIDRVGAGKFALGRLANTALWGVLFYGPSNSVFVFPQNVAIHELGHASRVSATGDTPTFQLDDSNYQTSNFFLFFLNSIGNKQSAQVTGANTGSNSSSFFNQNDVNLSALGGGVNAEMDMTRQLEEKATFYGTHYLNVVPYVEGKLSTRNYVDNTSGQATGDTFNLESIYTTKGYSISQSFMRTMSYLSLALSGTTYAFIRGALQYGIKGNPVVRPIRLGPFQLPDVNMYLGTKGLSYRVSTFYSGKVFWIPLAVEQTIQGDSRTELTIGYRRLLSGAALRKKSYKLAHVETVFGTGGVGARAWYEMSFGPNFWGRAGGTLANNGTFYGERNSTSFASRYAVEGFLKLGLRF